MERQERPFTSRMKTWQLLLLLLYLPVHLLGLPATLPELLGKGTPSPGMANFWLYAVGAVYVVALLWSFLRREIDPVFDHPFLTLLEVLRCYALLWLGETLASFLFLILGVEGDAANNQLVLELLRTERGPMLAASVFLAPLVEEALFRGAIFGSLRRKNRALAYAVSALLFCLYHVLPAGFQKPGELLFILLYLPGALALALCYERTNSLWGSILLHAFNNGLSIWLVSQG